MNHIQIKTWSVFASLENVDLICADISAWMMELNLPGHIFALELLVREALNNAIIHGSLMNPDRKVFAELQCDMDALRFKVRDAGAGFDWQATLERIIDDKRENGRGLKLYQLYADQVEFNERGNQVTLTRLFKNGISSDEN
ncbi:MAG: ATP-binding protein [Chloroflexi bacterium]|nr:ATP-binding protein [Chloroflexota bacterium]